MKIVARTLIVVALVASCLIAVHAFFLVRSDLQKPTPATIQPLAQPAPNPPAVEPSAVPKPTPAVVMKTEVQDAPQVDAAAPHQPQARMRTISLLPGEAFSLQNRGYRKVEVHSVFPLRVLTGRCHSDFTVQFFCEGDPSDIFLVDTRQRPIFNSPRANIVDVRVTEF